MARSINQAQIQLWKARLEQFTKSQLSVHEFCKSIHCSVSAYYAWKRKLQTPALPAQSKRSAESNFIPVTLRQDVASVVNVELPGGTKIHLPANAIEALRLVIEHDQRAA